MSPKRGKQKISQEDTLGSERERNLFFMEVKTMPRVPTTLAKLELLVGGVVRGEVTGVTGSQPVSMVKWWAIALSEQVT